MDEYTKELISEYKAQLTVLNRQIAELNRQKQILEEEVKFLERSHP